MKIERPQFELTRVYEDGTQEAPEIVPVTEMPWNSQMNRRGVLGVGLGAAAALFLLDERAQSSSTYQAENVLKAPEKPPPAHVNEVNALALTPDGKLLISGSHDNTVKLWSMPEGQWLATLPIHPGDITGLAITPDGKTLATACAATLRLWSLPDGQLRALLDAHTDKINAITIAPDGKLLISAGDDKTIRLWSLPEGRLLATLQGHTGPVQSLAVAPNGKVLAAGGKESRLRLWSLPEGRLLTAMRTSSAGRFAITPDSQMIAVGSYDVDLHSLADGRLLTTLKQGGNINAVAVSPDGKLLVSASNENLCVSSLPEGKLLRKIEKVGYNLSDFAFSSDSRMLLSLGGYDSARLWSLPDCQLLGQLQAGNRVSAALFAPDGQQLLTGGGSGSLARWGLRPPRFENYLFDPVFTASKPPDKTLKAHNSRVIALAVSADGKMLASSSNDKTAKLWSLPGGQLLSTLEGHKEQVGDVAVMPDGQTLITASDDKTIKLWALPDATQPAPAPAQKPNKKPARQTAAPAPPRAASKGRLLSTLEGHQAGVRRLLLSADGKTLASLDHSGAIKVWALPDGRLQATLSHPKNEMSRLALAPDGKLLAAATETREDHTVKLWSLPEGRLLTTLAGGGQIKALAFAPDGKLLAVADDDNSIRLWGMPNGNLIGSLEGPDATSLTFAPDGKLLAASSASGICLWSLMEGRLRGTIEEQQDRSGRGGATLVIAPTGQWLLSLVPTGSIKQWSLPEGRMLATFEAQMSGEDATAITPDGKTLATGDYSGVITLWDLEKPGFRTFLFDAAVNSSDVKGVSYNVYDQVTGRMITYTLPCGSPIPPGAVCTCNCVPGAEKAYSPPRSSGRSRSGGGGGYRICTCNKVCTCIPVPSDRNAKEAFETADPLRILQRLSELPIQSWNYKWDDTTIRHIGPMAQDFAAAFGVGEDDKHICPVDAQGVAFAAIQGLYVLLLEKEAQTAEILTQLHQQQNENEVLNGRIAALEQLQEDGLSEPD